MGLRKLLAVFFVTVFLVSAAAAQTRKPLTNADVVTMTKQGFDPSLIVKAIQTGRTDFDVSAQALVELKDAGVDQSVMEAMLSAQAEKPSGATDAVQGTAAQADETTTMDTAKRACSSSRGCLVREGDQVPLKFANSLTSKTANQGDPVEFVLDDDLKIGDTVVVAKGAHALATVSDAKKAGMLGKPGELAVQLQYLVAGDNRVRIRGTKGREGESKTGATVALTVLFGPIGLIKHGKNVEIPAGTPLTAYVDQDTWLPAVQ
jgi:hypothetical protein